MGKYMKKSKITGEVAVMEVSLSPLSSHGVHTRAKALALQRQQQQQQERKAHLSATTSTVEPDPDDSFSYLQLRSRRLVKPPLLGHTKNHRHQERSNGCSKEEISRPNSRLRAASVDSNDSVAFKGYEMENSKDLGVEASFGDNNSEIEGRDRESTPCNLIRDSDSIATPGSTTRRTLNAANRRVQNDIQRNIPMAHEMDEFFAFAEEQQQRIFIDKYNFDIVNDSPLPGRYEWVQVVP
ncbi:hypothetical protein FNV43_RR23084 [Rhamnella rubrinervis]|uniref:Cyclin-dependent kinase inhibitor domain-containing protein n=1 Tax=Rhamnella rubrinervis TaxID=2594499 RepID=A0A8K0DRC2_9ROSA|nr:hypothetical protein FNV43_RR23084 [Rhamnella rubrinervis]